MKVEVFYKPSFIRQFNALPEALQEEVLEKVALFKNTAHHKQLRVHNLKGTLAGRLSFSVNYRYRVVFRWITKDRRSAVLIAVGDHDVYR